MKITPNHQKRKETPSNFPPTFNQFQASALGLNRSSKRAHIRSAKIGIQNEVNEPGTSYGKFKKGLTYKNKHEKEGK